MFAFSCCTDADSARPVSLPTFPDVNISAVPAPLRGVPTSRDQLLCSDFQHILACSGFFDRLFLPLVPRESPSPFSRAAPPLSFQSSPPDLALKRTSPPDLRVLPLSGKSVAPCYSYFCLPVPCILVLLPLALVATGSITPSIAVTNSLTSLTLDSSRRGKTDSQSY